MVKSKPNTDTRMRGLIYARESESRRRTRTGKVLRGITTSVADQITECERAADHHNINIIDTIKDADRGASTYSPGRREAWEDKVIPAIEAGRCDVLITWECSRGTRDLEVYVALRGICRRTRTKWMYNGRLYDLSDTSDAFITGLDVLSAEREAGFTHDRVSRGVRTRAAAGRPHGRNTYGYRRIYDPDTGSYVKQVPDETTGPIVRELFRRYANGAGRQALATMLNKRGTPTPGGSTAWRKASITRILTNRAYLGDRMLNGSVVVSGAWEALVDESTWWTVQGGMTVEPSTTRPDTTVKYLLSGIARCGVCGTGLTSNNNKYATYYCGGRNCVGRSRKHLDAYITEVVLQIAERESEVGKRSADPRLGDIMRELTGLRAQLEAFEEQAVAGELSAAAYARIEKRLTPKIASADNAVVALRARASLPDMGGHPIREAWFLPEAEGGLSLPDKRQVIRAYVMIKVHPLGHRRRAFDPSAIEVVPVGETNPSNVGEFP